MHLNNISLTYELFSVQFDLMCNIFKKFPKNAILLTGMHDWAMRTAHMFKINARAS